MRTAQVHRSQRHKLAQFATPRCAKCAGDQMAIEEIMRGGTDADGEPLVWFRCAPCRALTMTRPVGAA